MIDLFIAELVKSAVAVAKDLLTKRIVDKNRELLEKKRKSESKSKQLTPDQVKSISLEPRERVKAELRFLNDETLTQLHSHLEETNRWANRVSFVDMRGSKGLNSIYIELDTYLMPMRTHMGEHERRDVKPLQQAIFASQCHCIILGQPGAGKTTAMKKLCVRFFEKQEFSGYSFPILFNLRDLETTLDHHAIQHQLRQLFPFELTASQISIDMLDKGVPGSLATELFLTAIDAMNILIILEGFDEIHTSDGKDTVLKEIRLLTKKLRNTKIIVTCRTGEFNYNIDQCDVFEISPLSSGQVSTFAEKWIGPDRAKQFLKEMSNSPFWDTAIKPLSLAHLCAIYERIGSIPDRPKTVYRKVVALLLEEWDEQRSIKRLSTYSNFEPDRKFEFLTHLSFYLTTSGRTMAFTQEQLIEAYLSICNNFRLPENQSAKVASELESHTGLFIQTGYRRFEFAHKSLQEYLAAEYIVKLPSLELISNYINTLGAELAIAISISSNPSLYFSELVLRLLNVLSPSAAFYDALISRLAQERPDFYPCEEIILALFSLINAHKHHQAILDLMKNILSANDVRSILKYYRIAKKDESHLTLHRKKINTDYKLKSTLSVPIYYFPEITYDS